VKPVKSGHPWDKPKVSQIQRCPHLRVQFAIGNASLGPDEVCSFLRGLEKERRRERVNECVEREKFLENLK
jgi:hypothetical protein